MPVAAASLANLRNGGPRGAGKIPASIKAMVEGALSDVGGRKWLAQQARENPVAFMGLVGRVLPLQLQSSDADGNPVHLHLIAARVVSDELHVHIQTDVSTKTIEHAPAPQGDLLDAPLPEE